MRAFRLTNYAQKPISTTCIATQREPTKPLHALASTFFFFSSLYTIDNVYDKLLRIIYISKIVLRKKVDLGLLYNYCIDFF